MKAVRCTSVGIAIGIGILAGAVGLADAGDRAVHSVRVYGVVEAEGTILVGGKGREVRSGDRVELADGQYDRASGTAFEKVDVVVQVGEKGGRLRDAEVRLGLRPKIGKLVFIADMAASSGRIPEVADGAASERTAVWFPTIEVMERRIDGKESDGSASVTFEGIRLGEIVRRLARDELWLFEVSFEASIEPTKDEADLANNEMARRLRIVLPPY